MRMNNRIGIVTAAASGMGRAGAKLFAKEGAKVAVVDINGEKAAEVAAELGLSAGAVYVARSWVTRRLREALAGILRRGLHALVDSPARNSTV